MPVHIAVLIPALNEERGIERVLAELPRRAAPADPGGPGVAPAGPIGGTQGVEPGPPPSPPFEVREVVVVDNGSTDRTAEAARRAGATVVSEPRRGYGAACLAGLAHLRRDPPEIVAFLDADHSDDPAELPDVLRPILERRADLVVGSRTLGQREPGSLSPVQRFGNGLATLLMRLAFRGRFTDLGPFRAIRWEALERLVMRDRDYGWTVEMQCRALKAGLRCAEVPVRYRRRRLGKSKVSGTLRGVIGAGVKILLTIARVRLGG
jgi:glycosyltransferase involved in cell wall biosynthesis